MGRTEGRHWNDLGFEGGEGFGSGQGVNRVNRVVELEKKELRVAPSPAASSLIALPPCGDGDDWCPSKEAEKMVLLDKRKVDRYQMILAL